MKHLLLKMEPLLRTGNTNHFESFMEVLEEFSDDNIVVHELAKKLR